MPEAEVPDFAAVVRTVRDEYEAGVLLIDHNMALIMEVENSKPKFVQLYTAKKLGSL